MDIKRNLKLIIGGLIFCFLAVQGPVSAESLSYDRYAPAYEGGEAPKSSSWSKVFANALVFPFYLLKWPTDKALYYIEKENLDKKALWFYEKLQDKGLSPSVEFAGISDPGAGVEVDFLRLAHVKSNVPDAVLKGWFHWTNDVRIKVGGEVGWDRIAETPVYVSLLTDYENRPNELFSGIGPDSSAGDTAVYSMETTTLGSKIGFSPSPIIDANAFFSYRNINISGGRDGGHGQRGELPTFSFERTPGIFGDSIITAGWEFIHDTRNQRENSTKGGKRRFSWSYNEGLNSSEARYFGYQAELTQYFRLGSDRRVLAVHVYGEHNDEINDGNVPFHQMAKLGGYGVGSKRLSQTLRGYEHDRFYDESAILLNIEYRYAIWEYRQFRLDTVFFWDEGQVFGEFSDFEFDDFKESYGLGFRLSLANITLLSLEAAHGDEGTNYYFKTSTPF